MSVRNTWVLTPGIARPPILQVYVPTVFEN